jgi:hypothetical protein
LLVFDDGSLALDAPGARDVDAYVSAGAPALMMMFIGRQGTAKLVLGGQIAAWGRRPWTLARILTAISPP